jgi:hypothetical protein
VRGEGGGGIRDILLEIDLSSFLQEKRDGGIVATGGSMMKRGAAILEIRIRGEVKDWRHYPGD